MCILYFLKNDLCSLKLLFLIFTYVLNFFNCSKPNAAPISEGSKLYPASENMNFLPKADLLTLEELDKMCSAFISQGVEKLRITGGEPLVRRNIMEFFESISRHLKTGELNVNKKINATFILF